MSTDESWIEARELMIDQGKLFAIIGVTATGEGDEN